MTNVERLNSKRTIISTVVSLIEAHGIVKTYGKIKALNGFDLSVKKNTVHALVGPNGSGKSTAVKILSGELKPDSGSVLIDGMPVASKEVQRMVSQVPDICQVPDNMTTSALLWKHGKTCRLAKEEIGYRIDVLTGMLGIDNVHGREDRRAVPGHEAPRLHRHGTDHGLPASSSWTGRSPSWTPSFAKS